MAKNYEVKIVESKGSCTDEVFELMATNGDISAEKVTENINKVIILTGYAVCHITTNEKEFDMGYYATTEGFLQTGSEVFKESVVKYFGKIDTFKVIEVKTKKGKTYKVTPVLMGTSSIEE